MTDPLDLAVTGATGRMGRAVLSLAADRENLRVVCAVTRDPATDRIEGVAIDPADGIESLLADRNPDVLIDFTAPDAAIPYARACADAGIAFVTGTTGFSDSDLDALEATSATVPVLRAPNFSPGIAVLADVIETAVSTLPNYDIELTETHHNRKRDAPSGTATTLLDRIERARGTDAETETGTEGEGEGEGEGAPGLETGSPRVYGREGIDPRENNEIGVHVRRAGDVRGEHELLLAGNDEVLSLSHRAESRAVFAAGALDAAAWIVGRDPGRYEFQEVLG